MSLRVLLGLTVLLWGASPLFDKLAIRGGPPFVIVAIRTAFIALCAGVVALLTGQMATLPSLSGRTILFTLLAGFTGGALGLGTYFYALQKGDASLIVPLTSAYPLVTVILSIVFLGEPFTLSKALGAALVVAGVMLLA
jgi:transporter family protein